MNKLRIPVIVAAAVVLLDQISKWLVVRYLPLYDTVALLPILDVTHVRNPGAAFGIFRDLPDDIRLIFFAIVLITAVLVILYFLNRTGSQDKLLRFSLGLILGGAIGNSIDRFRLRYVTDFIDFHWFGDPALHWPPFNIADSAITIGVILILFDTFITKRGK